MKATTRRNTLLLAVALFTTTLAGCADVRQDPASTTVTSDAAAPQAADARSSTNVPF
jgi:outer membrane murein-binding lipoprotein Lpp